jgi:bacterioferritin-associated ferredoxin
MAPTGTEYLCFCNQTYEAGFRDSIAKLGYPDFNAICMQTGVGINCTACVPDAEKVYLGVLAGEVRGSGTGPVAGTKKQRTFTDRFHRFMRRMSPTLPNTLRSVLPVIGGAGHRTIVSVHHGQVKAIKANLVPMRIDVRLMDKAGRQIGRKLATAMPGERVEIDVTEPFGRRPPQMDLLGTARVSIRAAGLGHVGIIRPHFRVETAKAASPVHSVDIGDTDSHHVFATAERSRSIAVTINGTDKAAHIRLRSSELSGDKAIEQEFILAPYGAAMSTVSDKAEGVRALHIESDQLQRSFFVVSDGDLISVDHI